MMQLFMKIGTGPQGRYDTLNEKEPIIGGVVTLWFPDLGRNIRVVVDEIRQLPGYKLYFASM